MASKRKHKRKNPWRNRKTREAIQAGIQRAADKRQHARLLEWAGEVAADPSLPWRVQHGEQTAPTDSEGGAPAAHSGKPTPAA